MTQIVFKNTKNPAPLQNYVKNVNFVDMIQDTYLSVSAPAEGLFKDNGSRFISYAYPVETEEEVKDIVSDLKKKYHDARHHCYAYRLGHLGDRFRANDDGEPSSSAGRPILGQIDSRGLSDTLVVVVRYFGGIKLGIPGLIRAYKTSTAEALDNAGTIEKVAGKWYGVRFGYQDMNQVMRILKDMDLRQKDQDFGVDCSLKAWVRLSAEADMLDRFSGIGSVVVEEIQ
jgi:uncharacterized YigZ family protein